jgi:purine-binding chemotaxis protein CheW
MQTEPKNENHTNDERQIVAMHLGQEVYGVDIAHIHTVITPNPITPVPQTPDYVEGVMNLRGRILPVIDLRKRFKVPSEKDGESYRIVIVEVEGLSAGLIVDTVSEVLRLKSSEIQAPSELLDTEEIEVITGIGRVPLQGKGECFILLLDVLKTLTHAAFDVNALAKLQEAA